MFYTRQLSAVNEEFRYRNYLYLGFVLEEVVKVQVGSSETARSETASPSSSRPTDKVIKIYAYIYKAAC